MSVTLKEYRFFRSFSTKIENWPMRKAEALWRKMRERKIAGKMPYLAKHICTLAEIEIRPMHVLNNGKEDGFQLAE